MYDLYQPDAVETTGGFVNPAWRRVRDGLENNLQKVRAYYQNNPKTLPASHLLVRLMHSLNISLNNDDYAYVFKAMDWTDDLSRSLKLTSAVSYGKLFEPGQFYGEGVSEAIIAEWSPFDIGRAVKNWKSIRPLRVLYHPFDNLNFRLPAADTRWNGEGFAVIGVHIPKLALQYKCWRRWESSVNDDSPQSVMQFLRALPIPNMLISHINISLLNRLMARFFDTPPVPFKAAHPFYLIDWSDPVDQVLESYLKFMANKNPSFSTIFHYMPSVVESMERTIRLPEQAFSIQLQWAIVLARVLPTAFMVQFAHESGNQANRLSIRKIERYLKRLESNHLLEHRLTEPTYSAVKTLIDDGIVPFL